jgi:hypothetical protein
VERKGIIDMLTSTICKGFIASLFILMFSQLSLAQQSKIKDTTNDTISFARIISGLGRERTDLLPIMKKLAINPRISTGLLIDSLHVISNPSNSGEEDPEAMHVQIIIGALAYLTGGMEFCSTSKHEFDTTDTEKSREHFLRYKYGDCLTFFAVWPSRGRLYIAPIDAQESIIKKWRDWYSTKGKDFKYIPLPDSSYWD